MSITLLTRYPVSQPFPSLRFLVPAWWTCYSAPGHTWRARSDVMIATGEAYSVVPYSTRRFLDPAIKPVPGGKGNAPAWFGVPCSFGRLRIWLPVEDESRLYRDFSLLVLLPKNDPPDTPPYVFLGTQFLSEYRATLTCDCSTDPSTSVNRSPGYSLKVARRPNLKDQGICTTSFAKPFEPIPLELNVARLAAKPHANALGRQPCLDNLVIDQHDASVAPWISMAALLAPPLSIRRFLTRRLRWPAKSLPRSGRNSTPTSLLPRISFLVMRLSVSRWPIEMPTRPGLPPAAPHEPAARRHCILHCGRGLSRSRSAHWSGSACRFPGQPTDSCVPSTCALISTSRNGCKSPNIEGNDPAGRSSLAAYQTCRASTSFGRTIQ